MTRVPKFRAWHKHSETMYEVKSIVYTLMRALGVNREALYAERTLELDDDSAILMQSTGLKDKNDVELFEGDIVTASGYEFMGVGVVRYEESLAGFVVEFIDKELIEKPQFIYQFRELEVIGNVHENKELLE